MPSYSAIGVSFTARAAAQLATVATNAEGTARAKGLFVLAFHRARWSEGSTGVPISAVAFGNVCGCPQRAALHAKAWFIAVGRQFQIERRFRERCADRAGTKLLAL